MCYAITDTKTSEAESYYTKLLASFTGAPGASRVISVDSSGAPDHFPIDQSSLYYAPTDARNVTVVVGAVDSATHDRVRYDKVDKAGKITWRYQGQMYSIGIGRTHTGTRVIVLSQDVEIRVIDAATGELLRELVLNPHIDYQPTRAPKGPTRTPRK